MSNNNLNFNTKIGLTGYYTLQVVQQDGTLKQGPGLNVPFKNLIVNSFCDPSNGWFRDFDRCKVGTGTAVPAVSDTALENAIATTAQYAYSTNFDGSTTTTAIKTRVFSFASGAVIGNISEVGCFNAYSGALFSRALIKDSEGNPTTITLVSTDQLSVTYTFQVQLPTTTHTGTMILTRDGVEEEHDWVYYPGIVHEQVPDFVIKHSPPQSGSMLYYTSATPAAHTKPPIVLPHYSYATSKSYTFNSSLKRVTVNSTFGVGQGSSIGMNVIQISSGDDGYNALGYFYFNTPFEKLNTQVMNLVVTYDYVLNV